jgi:hypothetical protein
MGAGATATYGVVSIRRRTPEVAVKITPEWLPGTPRVVVVIVVGPIAIIKWAVIIVIETIIRDGDAALDRPRTVDRGASRQQSCETQRSNDAFHREILRERSSLLVQYQHPPAPIVAVIAEQ